MGKMNSIDRKLLSHLCDVVWNEALEGNGGFPSTSLKRYMIKKAIEIRREEKYEKEKVYKYADWVKTHTEQLDNKKTCNTCDGSGWIMAHCGDERCGKCNGTGKVNKDG